MSSSTTYDNTNIQNDNDIEEDEEEVSEI